MKKYFSYVLVGLVCLLIGVVSYNVLNRSNNISEIYDSLVYIEVTGDGVTSNGSGFVYRVEDGKNYIATSYHVVDGYKDIYVYNTNKNKVRASVIGYNEVKDIAVISIDDKLGLSKVKIDRSNKVNVGDEVYVAGTPINLNYISTITSGIVSFKDRKIIINTSNGSREFNAIQVDTPINPGNSGGALLNKNGKVIGMVFVREADIDGVGFALPIDFVIDTVNEIEKSFE